MSASIQCCRMKRVAFWQWILTKQTGKAISQYLEMFASSSIFLSQSNGHDPEKAVMYGFSLQTDCLLRLARKFGTALLTFSMSRRHEIQFKSYDRLFPSQDTMPKGGLGSLIALPFQKAARKKTNREFVDDNFDSYDDQWAFLSTIQKISQNRLEYLISELSDGHELGVLKKDEEEETEKPWETSKDKIRLQKNDFPKQLDVVIANMLFIPKAGISQRALNRLKRLASFNNPMFYKRQAMRLSTYGHDRKLVSCADETQQYLSLPRGYGARVVP